MLQVMSSSDENYSSKDFDENFSHKVDLKGGTGSNNGIEAIMALELIMGHLTSSSGMCDAALSSRLYHFAIVSQLVAANLFSKCASHPPMYCFYQV